MFCFSRILNIIVNKFILFYYTSGIRFCFVQDVNLGVSFGKLKFSDMFKSEVYTRQKSKAS